jgi:hypothetical protein
MQTRRELLLEMVAEQYEQMRDPLGQENLSTHKITSDEMAQVCDDIATAVRVYLKMPTSERVKYTLKGEVEESLLSLVTNSLKTKEIRRKMEGT